MNSKLFFILFSILVTACSSHSPLEKSARSFIDCYYVMANQKSCLPISDGQATTLLKNEIELVKGIRNQNYAYKSRDITFEKKKELKSKNDTSFLYELKIFVPNSKAITKMIRISVNHQTKKITSFGELNDL